MRVPTSLTLTALTVVAAAAWWLGRRDDSELPAPAATRSPGYYLRDAELQQTDATGRMTLKVRAAAASQAEQHGDIELTDLKLDYLPLPGRVWRMTASAGRLPADVGTVLLTGDVRLAAPAEGRALVRTERLQLDIERQVATTDDAVRIELPPHAVTARGLRADLKRETLRLESAVNGTFTR